MATRPGRLAWRKTISAKGESAWLEKLELIGLERIAVTGFPGRKTLCVQAFGLSAREAEALSRRFGGSISETPKGTAGARRTTPIRIRDRLVLVDSPGALDEARGKFPGREVIAIPAGAAFGTGEHATTASCLRLLCDLCSGFEEGRKWTVLDLGTGSGILAIAARKLGAGRVEAWDCDWDAVRTARANVRANGADRVVVKKGAADAAKGGTTWDVVMANLYSEVLIHAAGAIVRATRAGGWVILSGILREQEGDCRAAFEGAGARVERAARSGKWATLLLHRGGAQKNC